MKRIVILCKGVLEDLPPVMSAAMGMAGLGASVTVLVSSCLPETISRFKQRGIAVVQLQEGAASPKGILQKIRYWQVFGKRAWKAVSQTTHDLLWVGSADTALALGRRLLRNPYILQQHELYDKHPMYKHQLRRYTRGAISVVVPEACRAGIIRCWYRLPQAPFVLPNKPDGHPHARNMQVGNRCARQQLDQLTANERMVLYQGRICMARDVRPVAEAVCNLGQGWRFVAMGQDRNGYLDVLKQAYPELIHIPKIVAPAHLQVTSRTHIGVVAYSHDCLNHVFCAPNKVWEYAGFGVPMLCNDLPALRFQVQASGAGLSVDFQRTDRIATSLQQIDRNYQSYSQSARKLYDSIDFRGILERILEHASSHMPSGSQGVRFSAPVEQDRKRVPTTRANVFARDMSRHAS